jgi:hypothetical protein
MLLVLADIADITIIISLKCCLFSLYQREQATRDNDGDVSYISQNKQHFNEIMMVMSAI